MALIIKNGYLVTENGIIKADMLIENEKISRIDCSINEDSGDVVIDAAGKMVIPGVIDAHVHYNMKTDTGRTADDFETGTISAAFGGVTSFVDFASPLEGKSLLESLKIRENEARGHSYLDYSFHMEITGEFEQDFSQLSDLKDYGITSLKVYTTYGSLQLPDEKILRLLKKAKEADMLVLVHAEDNEIINRLKERFILEGKTAPAYHGDSRPKDAEIAAIRKILNMAREAEAPVYIVHVSTGEGAEIIRKAKEFGQKVYGETCPHYLLLTDSCYKGIEPQKYIMTPPLREKEDQEILWRSLDEGMLQCVTTDHCSFHIKDKLSLDNCFDVPPGIGGSETLLPLLYNEAVNKGKLTLEKLVCLISTNPAKMFGIYPQKGVLKVGSDGDIVIFDPEKEVTLKSLELHSAAGYTVYESRKVKGYPVVTISRGMVICENSILKVAKPEGKFIKAQINFEQAYGGTINEL